MLRLSYKIIAHGVCTDLTFTSEYMSGAKVWSPVGDVSFNP